MTRSSFVALTAILSSFAHAPSVATTIDPTCGWNATTRAMARETYLYAQLASDVYLDEQGDPPDFVPDSSLQRLDEKDNDDSGLAYAVYERRRGDQPPERIISFRGTEGFSGLQGQRDWRFGNLRLDQQDRGLLLYDEWRRRTDAVDPRIPIRVTGHSLGGAIAIQISLCRPNVDTYVFNTSPRFHRCGAAIDNHRVSVVEYGEILKIPRIFGREATQQYNSIGCVSGMNPVGQHQMRRLAECLTRIAAIDDATSAIDDEARQSLDRNPAVPGDCRPRRGRSV